VSKLGALGEPKSLTLLRGRVEKMLPKMYLPELQFEVHGWTGFLDAFVHLGDGTTRGRIAKTEHLLRVVDPVDDTYRRQMNRQLTVPESRHKRARDVCHGKRGTIHQAYRDGMEGQLGSLGLVLNAVVLWTTRYIDAAVAQLRAEGHEIRDEDIARLSPLKHRNLNVLGRYSLTASTPAGGAHARFATRTQWNSTRTTRGSGSGLWPDTCAGENAPLRCADTLELRAFDAPFSA